MNGGLGRERGVVVLPRINEGLRLARGLLLSVNELGLPCGCEFLAGEGIR